VYDQEGNLLGASKSFSDYNGKSTQAQSISTRTLNVFANQSVSDHYGRPVLSTLTAPTYQDRLTYKADFVKANNNENYAAEHFDEPDASQTLGEQHSPYPVQNTVKGELGWYYSNNNTDEPYQDRTDYPYSRMRYATYDPRQVVESSAPHNAFRMGSGHESKSYQMPAGGELAYLFGYGGGWNVGANYHIEPNYDPTDPTSVLGGIGTILTEEVEYDYKVYKTIQYSPEGHESVMFSTLRAS